MTDQKLCITCRKPKANYDCGLCQGPLCKACAQFLTETFSFKKNIPETLKHSCYCGSCFDQEVSGPLKAYEETMEKARELLVFTKEQSKITRLLKRKETPVTVDACEDNEEAVLRLAFQAVELGYNCIVDVQLNNRKIIVGSHKKTIFDGIAYPVNVNPDELGRYRDV